ncbi:MAG: hypothetical protein IJL89_02330 [Firmicutes bacterium]|nr:hypothetical protein [Bacillota bacterium]
MKLLHGITAGLMLTFALGTSVFAASANFTGKVEYVSKDKVLSGNNFEIKLAANEIEAMKDCIKITLDGAKWDNYKDSGRITAGVNYTKTSSNVIELHLEPTEDMLKSTLTIKMPATCTVTENLANITATVSWGLPEYADKEMTIAKVHTSYAYRDSDIKLHKKGDKIYQSGNKFTYNNLKIKILPRDVNRLSNKITVTLDGAEWSDYESEGKVSNNRSKYTRYEKVNSKTIKIINDVYEDNALVYDNYLTLPLTGTITGTGEIKAIVDFGVSDIKPSEVVFARCVDGTVSLSADNAKTPVDVRGKVSDVTITDSSTQGYGWDKKITLKLNFGYHFSETPLMECTGKFKDKCKIEISKTDSKQCIIHIYNAEKGSTGTIELKNIIIERAENNVPNKPEVKMTLNASGWEEYEDTVQIAAYAAGAEYFQDYIKAATNANAQANNDCAFLGRITFTDSSTRSYNEGDKIEISFDNDFVWFTRGKLPAVGASGKFADACAFEYDNTNPAKAYIVFTKKIPAQGEGTITLDNAVLERKSSETFETVKMTAGIVSLGKENYVTIQAAKFTSLLNKTPETTIETTTEATTADTADGGVKLTAALNIYEIIKEILADLL